jgi:glycosyltransferase involved in cell wall biosynthesis
MLEAYKSALLTNNEIGNLYIVGEGPERTNCEAFINKHNLHANVTLYGHVSDIETLRDLYSESVVSLSPGYVGLSITQSFSFGTPILISKTEPHAPEIEAAVVNKNCLFFETDNSDDFASKILKFWAEKAEWQDMQNEIIEDCKERYSAEIMAEKLLEAFKKCQN